MGAHRCTLTWRAVPAGGACGLCFLRSIAKECSGFLEPPQTSPARRPSGLTSYKLWNDGQSLSVTCAGADNAESCLFWCMGLAVARNQIPGHPLKHSVSDDPLMLLEVNASCSLSPWLVQTYSNNDMADLAAANLFIYGRRAHGGKAHKFSLKTDLQKCSEQSGDSIFAAKCGDRKVSADEDIIVPFRDLKIEPLSGMSSFWLLLLA